MKRMGSCFLLLVFSLCGSAQSVDKVFSRYISFIGGERRWKAIRTIVDSGSYNYGGMVFPFLSYAKAPDQYKFVVPFKGKYFAQAYDGKEGWKIDAFKGETKKTLLQGKAALSMMNEAEVTIESPFIDYKKKGYRAELDGKDSIEGKLCYKIRFFRSGTDTAEAETYYFDAGSYALVRKVALAKNTELDNSVLETTYSDYRAVQGVKVPFMAVSKVKDQTILTIAIRKMEVDIPLGDDLFLP